MKMLLVLLIVYCIFASARWFVRYVDMLTLVYYIRMKEIPSPRELELDECRKKVWKNFWKHALRKR